MNFSKENLDFSNNPYSGLTRESWLEAGTFLLSGIFQYLESINSPIILPREETQITYPHDENNELEKMAERFEGLARSFFIAAPLIHDDPTVSVCNISVKEYYKLQILRSCTKGDPLCVGHVEELLKDFGEGNSYRTFQQTVESAALVIGLWISKEEIWDSYTRKEQDVIAEFIRGYAYGNTITNNWQLFNMLDLAFLNMVGYPIDQTLMKQYAQNILDFYAGDGWYRDGHSFDYYSCWGFNLYAPIWNIWYGYENEPALAAKFEEYSNTLMSSFSQMFDRDGFVNMWGRSMIYRNAPTSAFFGNLLLKNSQCAPGSARRISSGALKQFLERSDTLAEGIPTLGFYGQFSPLIQGYSCAASPLWIGKAFLCLYFPKEHPFWQNPEENGIWETLAADEVAVTTLNAPGLCFSNHEANGETLLRTGKVLRNPKANEDLWNYARLAFNTKYPWEATPANHIESQQYVLKNLLDEHTERGNLILWAGERKQVLYRRLFFNFTTPTELTWLNKLDVADFPVANGLIRVDKLHLLRQPMEVTFSSFGFPDNHTTLTRLTEGQAQAVILKGYDSKGQEKQLAMTIYDGWDDIEVFNSTNTNSDSKHSIILFAKMQKKEVTPETPILISQIITRESHEDFSLNELFPIKSIQHQIDVSEEICLHLKSGIQTSIDYHAMEGQLYL